MTEAKTIDVFPNPYAAIDHASRLAGICPEGEPMRDGEVYPVRRFIRATREVLDYRAAEVVTVGTHVGHRPSKTSFRWMFVAQPMTVPFDREMAPFYLERLRNRECFEIVGPGQAKVYDHDGKARKVTLLEALAEARLAAFETYRANYQQDPQTSEWAEQFAPDAEVAKAMEPLDVAAKKAREEAAAEAKKKAEAAAAEKATPFPLTPPAPAPEGQQSSASPPAAEPSSGAPTAAPAAAPQDQPAGKGPAKAAKSGATS